MDENAVIDKIFIRRGDGKPWFLQNVVKSYFRDAIKDILNKYGFTCEIFSYSGVNNEEKDYYLVIAKKQRRLD